MQESSEQLLFKRPFLASRHWFLKWVWGKKYGFVLPNVTDLVS